jgi:acyl carrier protein
LTTATTSEEKLRAAFAQSLGLDPSSGCEDAAYGKTPGWDSVAHMALVAEVEAAFDIMLDTDDVIDMSSYQKAREIAGKYGISFTA